jgi:hypothetical protein
MIDRLPSLSTQVGVPTIVSSLQLIISSVKNVAGRREQGFFCTPPCHSGRNVDLSTQVKLVHKLNIRMLPPHTHTPVRFNGATDRTEIILPFCSWLRHCAAVLKVAG